MHVTFCIFDEGGLKEEGTTIKEVGSFLRTIELRDIILLVESKNLH